MACESLQEREHLHVEFHETRSQELRARLVENYWGLAMKLARRATRSRSDEEDLRQVALYALLKAIDRYEPARGVGFSTYAWATITGELKRYHRDHDWNVRVPRGLQEVYLRSALAVDDCGQALGRSPTFAEIAAETGDDEETVIEALAIRGALTVTSLDAMVDSGDEAAVCGGDAGFETADSNDLAARLVARLSERQQRIVRLRFWSGLSQSQIAQEMGLSQMQVSRLLGKALRQMRVAASAST